MKVLANTNSEIVDALYPGFVQDAEGRRVTVRHCIVKQAFGLYNWQYTDAKFDDGVPITKMFERGPCNSRLDLVTDTEFILVDIDVWRGTLVYLVVIEPEQELVTWYAMSPSYIHMVDGFEVETTDELVWKLLEQVETISSKSIEG